jgi:8-oxo-dGTP pyrophosphatase MutT (NUDIX family)
MINLFLKDDQFETKGTPHTRKIVRGILFNEENKICILSIKRDDAFGNQSYYETSGGGIDEGEDEVTALKRELDEEVGVKTEILDKVGVVDDYYNLISRHNINNYYLARVIGKTKIHHASDGDDLIQDILWLDIDEVIKLYENMEDNGVSLLVKRRELPILKETKRMMEDK